MTVLAPKTEAELVDEIRATTGPLSIQGGATRGAATEGQILSTSGLSGVTLYEPGALTLVAQAGTPVETVKATLAASNQRLAFEPMDHRTLLGTTGTPTLGGIFSANVSGPRRIQVGAARDFALGIRMVDGAGTAIKNGGRVMKNVTGYDMVKLMCGAWGTLGVLSEISLKVMPVPESETTLVVESPDTKHAVTLMAQALGTPFDISGVASVDGKTMIRIEGFSDSVAYRKIALIERLRTASTTLEGEESAQIWRDLRDVTRLKDMPNVWKISLKPSDTPAYLEELSQTHPFETQLDWAGGLIWIGAQTPDLHADAQSLCARLGGHATLVKTSATHLTRFQPEPSGIAALTSGLRARFDPHGRFNPGLMAAA